MWIGLPNNGKKSVTTEIMTLFAADVFIIVRLTDFQSICYIDFDELLLLALPFRDCKSISWAINLIYRLTLNINHLGRTTCIISHKTAHPHLPSPTTSEFSYIFRLMYEVYTDLQTAELHARVPENSSFSPVFVWTPEQITLTHLYNVMRYFMDLQTFFISRIKIHVIDHMFLIFVPA